MPTWGLKGHNASLVLADTPVRYAPPRGPAVYVTFTYDWRQNAQSQIFSYTNLGPKWTVNWLAYAKEVATYCGPFGGCTPEHVAVYLRGGGGESHNGPPAGDGTYP